MRLGVLLGGRRGARVLAFLVARRGLSVARMPNRGRMGSEALSGGGMGESLGAGAPWLSARRPHNPLRRDVQGCRGRPMPEVPIDSRRGEDARPPDNLDRARSHEHDMRGLRREEIAVSAKNEAR